jgi:hypothetical protein
VRSSDRTSPAAGNDTRVISAPPRGRC